MKRLIALVVSCLALCACGGGGSGSGTTNNVATPSVVSTYKGTYQGTWLSSIQNGFANILVDQNGLVSGTLSNKTTSHIATITSGSVDESGNLNFLYKYPTDTVSGTVTAKITSLGNTITINGTNNISNNKLFITAQLINKDAVIDLSNTNTTWSDSPGGYFVSRSITIKQNGQNISGTFGGTGTVTGTISGSVISLTFSPSSGIYNNFVGLVSTGFTYSKVPVTSIASPGGQCIIQYDTDLLSGNVVKDVFIKQ